MESKEQIYPKKVEINLFIFEILMLLKNVYEAQSKIKYYNLFTLFEYLVGDQGKVYLRQGDFFLKPMWFLIWYLNN